jgi:hypothetical protein
MIWGIDNVDIVMGCVLQIQSAVSKDCPLFQPFPPEIVFSGYKAFKKYSTILQLRNNDKVSTSPSPLL